jgi:ornithine decarboxylase
MKTVLDLGCKPEQIIFANPIKTQAQLEFAAKHKVWKMTFDSEEELEKIARHCSKAEVVLRIGTVATDAKWELSSKFGAFMEDVPKLLSEAKRLKLNLIGVSFHVGTGGVSFTSYEESLMNAKKVFELAVKAGMKPLRLLDIGGGYAMCKIDPAQKQKMFTAVAPQISRLIDELFDSDVEVIGEPGTFVAESSLFLISRIIGTKTITQDKNI